jgi:hypothetical protein
MVYIVKNQDELRKSIFMIKVKLKIFESEGYLCAAGVGVGIYTYARTWNKLMKNIHEAVEAYFDIPSYTEARMILDIAPRVSQGAEAPSG